MSISEQCITVETADIFFVAAAREEHRSTAQETLLVAAEATHLSSLRPPTLQPPPPPPPPLGATPSWLRLSFHERRRARAHFTLEEWRMAHVRRGAALETRRAKKTVAAAATRELFNGTLLHPFTTPSSLPVSATSRSEVRLQNPRRSTTHFLKDAL